jgi:predicted glutamine amidotransferase
MCEQFVARSARPFSIGDLWSFAERLERFGSAGFGWGAAWIGADGALGAHRDLGTFHDDPARERIGATKTTSLLVHLRRPSKLSTLTPEDAQPFVDPGARFALGHNGDLRDHRRLRERYRAQGRIHGRADSEVAARWLEDEWQAGEKPAHLLGALHDVLGGEANFALLLPDGSVHHYAGNPENPVFGFRLGDVEVLSTAIYSVDRSLFRLVCPEARDRRVVRLHVTASLG